MVDAGTSSRPHLHGPAEPVETLQQRAAESREPRGAQTGLASTLTGGAFGVEISAVVRDDSAPGAADQQSGTAFRAEPLVMGLSVPSTPCFPSGDA